jgi:hypothetical protein
MRGTAPGSFAHWESYYRRGEITTCPVGTEANYSAELRTAWVYFFQRLKNQKRLQDITHHALSLRDVQKLERQLAAVGFAEFAAQPQTHAGNLVGRRVTFRSAPPAARMLK